MRKPTKQQIREWVENPVTLYFRSLALDEIDEFQQVHRTTDVFHPFEPQKTQEVIAANNAAIDVWEDVAEALKGEGMLYVESSEDEDEESIGY